MNTPIASVVAPDYFSGYTADQLLYLFNDTIEVLSRQKELRAKLYYTALLHNISLAMVEKSEKGS